MSSNQGPNLGASTQPLLTSPQRMRDFNAAAVLSLFWDAPADAGIIASEILERTGLSRATVLAICDDLRQQGWLVEDRAPSTVPGKGRQARRFTFNRSRDLVLASDVGYNSVTTAVADLQGTILGRVHRSIGHDELPQNRTRHLVESFEDVLHQAGVPSQRISAACIGVAAPVDSDGETVPRHPYWDILRIDRQRIVDYAPWWRLDIANDADLAALAEHATAREENRGPVVTLLASERLGAGIVVNGELLRGAHGAAGEMRFLDHIYGPYSVLGLASRARLLVGEAIRGGRDTLLKGAFSAGDMDPTLEEVLVAAESGDAVADEVLESISRTMAVGVSMLSSVVDPAVVVIAGGAASVAARLLPRIEAHLTEMEPFSPVIEISRLGRDVVVIGGVKSAITGLRRSMLPT